MTRNRWKADLTAANPLTPTHAAALPVTRAQRELLQGVLNEPAPAPAPSPGPTRRARGNLRPRIALGVAGAVVAGAVLTVVGGGAGDRSGTVWAAELVRFADTSPLVLLRADGWRVEYADEQSAIEGELDFRRGPAQPPSTGPVSATAGGKEDVPTTTGQLNWRSGALSVWSRDRAASADAHTQAPVLGTTADVYQYAGGHPGHEDITALWRYDGRVLEFRAGAADIPAFEALLAGLQRVDANTWLSALPDSVVTAAGRPAVIAGMLKGVTLPPGFDPSTIKGPELTKDRYQLGAAVTGTVACAWFKRWSDARAGGDATGVREAIAALATAKDWPILSEMAKQGAYPEVLEMFVAAMPSGRWYGRPLAGDVDSGLGCPQLGIPLADPATRP